jgi:hypothetical protein
MMYRIFHNDIKNTILKELKTTQSSLTIISAYVKLPALKFIDKNLERFLRDKKLLLRFRLEDLINGSTDITIYDYCKQNGWKVFINLDLHSKVYIFDDQRFILGSANVTSSGLGLGEKNNIESMVFGELQPKELVKINKLFKESMQLNDLLFKKMMKQVEKIDLKMSNKNYKEITWEDDILSHFTEDVQFIWSTELIFSNSPLNMNEHDMELLGIRADNLYDIELIRSKFKTCKAYKWLKSVVKTEMYFGELTEKLHSSLIDDPTPYRKDVKKLLSNLLNWIIELSINEFIIDRPNYSQRVRRVYP